MIDGRSGGRAGRSTAGLDHMHSKKLNPSRTGKQYWVADGMADERGWMIKSMVEAGSGMEENGPEHVTWTRNQ